MQLETPDPSVHFDLSPENVKRLKTLEKKRKIADHKYWFLLLSLPVKKPASMAIIPPRTD
jgi:hypothetical protein